MQADSSIVSFARARWVLVAAMGANLAVAIAKIVVGIVSGSAAIRADGFHSLVDGASNVFGLVALTYAMRPPDRTHAYGHRKIETFASLGIAALLTVLVIETVREAIARFLTGQRPEIAGLAFAIMGATLAVNAIVAYVERRAGEAFTSDFLIADSRQTQADILVSAGVIVGIGLTAAGVTHADTVASLFVAAAIACIGFQIARRGALVLLDEAILPRGGLEQVIQRTRGVRSWHKVRTRGRSDEVFVDLHIGVDPGISVQLGHAIAHEVQDAIRTRYPEVRDVTVHVEPVPNGQDGSLDVHP
ncbi:MAG: cation transporter [Actinobacteria bacterium]|nr:cation transporter [Actinomycetota bacterium]